MINNMKGNKYLKLVFKMIFDREFDDEQFSDRLLMQRTVYLLQCLGVPIGEYSFSLIKRSKKIENNSHE